MADAASWFSWEEHFLDVLLVFWISSGLLIVLVINSLTTFFGPLQPRISWDKSKDGGASKTTVAQGPTGPESTFWLNSALNWFYLHYSNFPQFVDTWVVSLNDQSNKLGGPVQVKFEKVQSGSLPPKFGEVTFDSGPEDKYVVNCRVDSRDLSFAVFASQQTHQGVKLTNLIVTILKLRGHLRIRCFRNGTDMMAETSFSGRPDIKVQGKPVNPYMDPSDMVDVGVVEEVIRNTICLTSTTFNLSQWIGSAEPQGIPVRRTPSNEMGYPSENLQLPSSPTRLQQHQQQQQQQMQQQQQQQQLQQQQQQKQQQVFETVEAKEAQQQHHSAFQVPSLATTPNKRPPTQQRLVSDKRLLVKVIKASGIKQAEKGSSGVDPYCVVHVDRPPQSELTNVVRSSFNPFWDEQFYFDLTRDSQEIRFELLDKRKPQNENFLGEAVVYCEDLQRNPSSRQIIPLQGRLGAGEFVSGSITVEFLCYDATDDTSNSSMSPRRLIETSKSVTPGGTLVTSTMTTTQKQHNSNYDANIDGSPSYIEKRGFDYDITEPDHGSSEVIRINGVESVAETAIRALSERPKGTGKTPTKTSTLIITGVKREPAVPAIKMTESSPTDEDLHSGGHMATASSPESPEISYPVQHKEKTSFAAKIRKRFSRSKKRSLSADRASSSMREDAHYLRPPGPQSKEECLIDSDVSLTTYNSSNSSMCNARDDIDLHKHPDETPNLKKSRSLGGSLKKLFRRSRKRSRSQGRGEQSRESSMSRQSRHTSQGPSREGSINRMSSQSASQQDTVIL